MNELLRDIQRVKAQVDEEEKARVRILVFHDMQDLHQAIRNILMTENPSLGFTQPPPLQGVAMVVEPALAKEKGKIIASSDKELADALIKDLREKPGRIWKE